MDELCLGHALDVVPAPMLLWRSGTLSQDKVLKLETEEARVKNLVDLILVNF